MSQKLPRKIFAFASEDVRSLQSSDGIIIPSSSGSRPYPPCPPPYSQLMKSKSCSNLKLDRSNNRQQHPVAEGVALHHIQRIVELQTSVINYQNRKLWNINKKLAELGDLSSEYDTLKRYERIRDMQQRIKAHYFTIFRISEMLQLDNNSNPLLTSVENSTTTNTPVSSFAPIRDDDLIDDAILYDLDGELETLV